MSSENDFNAEPLITDLTQSNSDAALQKQKLFAKIWNLQNELRGNLDGWDFKNYILGFLFYRFISEDFARYIDKENAGSGLKSFQDLSDEEVEEWKEDLVEEKGFFIYPSQLFINICKNAAKNPDLNEKLAQVFIDIESSSVGYESESDFKHLFIDLDVNSPKLGNSPETRNKKLASVLTSLAELDFDFSDSLIDVLGDTYEFLIGQYASSAGKKGGEFFTPQEVSTLLARLATVNKENMTDLKVYDPTCGSSSLLLKFAKEISPEHISGFYGQELNPTTYNLARMNMFLHGIPFNKFHIANGDTLTEPQHLEEAPFDCVVANPPYSVKWEGNDNPLLIGDERFSPAGVLAPKGKADLAFVMHILHQLANDGTAAIVEFPGVLYRGGAEQKIRKYLIDNNFVDTVIALPPDLFFGTTISTCILVLRKNKSKQKTLFIDASKEFVKRGKQNHLTPEHIDKVINTFKNKEETQYFSAWVDNDKIKQTEYDLTINKYVEAEDIIEKIDIDELDTQIHNTVNKINNLRNEINQIISVINTSGGQNV